MSQIVDADSFNDVVAQLLDEYGDVVVLALGETADEITDAATKIVKSNAPKKTGEYKKHIKAKKEKNRGVGDVQNYVYVASPEYRIAHLLEHGHAVNGGTGRVPAHHHFQQGEEYVKSQFETKLRSRLEEK